jgi:hypothetical protein
MLISLVELLNVCLLRKFSCRLCCYKISFLIWSSLICCVQFFNFGSVSLWMKISLSASMCSSLCSDLSCNGKMNQCVDFICQILKSQNESMCWFCNTQVTKEQGTTIPDTFVPYLAMTYFDRFLSHCDMTVTENTLLWYFIKFLFLSRFLC